MDKKIRDIRDFFMRRAFLLPVALLVLLGVFFLTFHLVHLWKEQKEAEHYAEKKVALTSKEYNEDGLRYGQTLSETPGYVFREYDIYPDRVIKKYDFSEEGPQYFAECMEALRKALGEKVRIAVLPIPARVQFEKYCGDSNEQYLSYVNALKREMPDGIELADCQELLRENGGKNLFYRTESWWNSKGAYYGYLALCRAMGLTEYASDHFILYQNNSLTGSLVNLAEKLLPDSEVLEKYLKHIPPDPFYYMISRGSSNYETVRETGGDSYKRPLIVFADTGGNSIVGGKIDYAVIPGKGNGTLLLIADHGGKMLAPFFTENYETVIVFDVERYAGTDCEEVLKPYEVTDVIVTQNAERVGIRGWSKFLNTIVNNRGKRI